MANLVLPHLVQLLHVLQCGNNRVSDNLLPFSPSLLLPRVSGNPNGEMSYCSVDLFVRDPFSQAEPIVTWNLVSSSLLWYRSAQNDFSAQAPLPCFAAYRTVLAKFTTSSFECCLEKLLGCV